MSSEMMMTGAGLASGPDWLLGHGGPVSPSWLLGQGSSLGFNPWVVLSIVLGFVALVLIRHALGEEKLPRGEFTLGVLAAAAGMAICSIGLKLDLPMALLLMCNWLAVYVGIFFLSFRQPVYGALSFAAIVFITCGIYVLNGAPFVAAATMIVYAGAIIIVFLFVLMFAQSNTLQQADLKLNSPWASATAGALLLMLMLLAIRQIPASAAASKPSSTVASLGKAMFTDYLWTVELAGALLLIATVAAILIAQDDDHDSEEAYETDSDTHPIARS